MKPRDLYEVRAKSLIKDLRESHGVSCKELARRLEPYGVLVDDPVLVNRINRGGLSSAFAMQVAAALSATTLPIPHLPTTKVPVNAGSRSHSQCHAQLDHGRERWFRVPIGL